LKLASRTLRQILLCPLAPQLFEVFTASDAFSRLHCWSMSKVDALSRFKLEVDPIVARKWIEPKRCVTTHNALCELCRKTFPNHAGAILNCIYCNVVCHVKCMTEFHQRLNPKKEWICFYCIDYLDESKQTHKTKQENNLCLAKFTHSQIVVAKYWRRFSARKFYIQIYNLIVYLQVRFRVNRRKAAFHKQVQGKMRPFTLRIIRCSNLNLDLTNKKGLAARRKKESAGTHAGGDAEHSSGAEEPESNFIYVVATVLDLGKGHLSQTWRLSSELVPVRLVRKRVSHADVGASAVRPHADQAAHPGHPPGHHPPPPPHLTPVHHVLQQPKHLHVDCSVLLGGVSGYQYVVLTVFQRGSCSRDLLLGQTYVDLSQGMLWKRGGSFSKPLEAQDFAVKDHLGMDTKSDCRPRPQGSIDFELLPVQGLCAGCGIVYAPCAEDLVRLVSLQPRFPGFTVPRPTGGTQDRRKLGAGLAGGALGVGGGGGGSSIHVKMGWVAIADGRIYLYGHFGDSLKVRINVEHFSFFATIRDRAVVYILRSPDFPDLEFRTSAKEEELRWKCAFLSTFRAAQQSLPHRSPPSGETGDGDNSTHNTNSNGASRALPQPQYDMRALVRDLALVEVSRYNGKEAVQLHFYSPGGVVVPQQQLLGASNRHHQQKAAGSGGGSSKQRKGSAEAVSSAVPFLPQHDALLSVAGKGRAHPQHLPPLSALKGSVSTSSIASSSSSSLTAVADSSQQPVPGRHRSMQIAVTSASLASAAAAASSKGALRGLFAEIDSEIAQIEQAKSACKQAFKEYRDDVQASLQPQQPQQQQGQAQRRGSMLLPPQLPHSHSQGPHRHASQRSLHSTASRLLGLHRASSSLSHASADHEGSGTATGSSTQRQGAPTLQGIREAVSDMCAAEEGVLNDKLNSVGAAFVAKVLTAIKQKQHTHS
jgi:hypothetical protein